MLRHTFYHNKKNPTEGCTVINDTWSFTSNNTCCFANSPTQLPMTRGFEKEMVLNLKKSTEKKLTWLLRIKIRLEVKYSIKESCTKECYCFTESVKKDWWAEICVRVAILRLYTYWKFIRPSS